MKEEREGHSIKNILYLETYGRNYVLKLNLLAEYDMLGVVVSVAFICCKIGSYDIILMVHYVSTLF